MQTIISEYDLILSGVSKGFPVETGEQTVLSNITLQFHAGRSYAIVGASGSGKSTLLHVLAGLEAPSSGTVMWGNKSIESLSSRELEQERRRTIGVVFQHHYLVPELSVRDNIALAGLIGNEPVSGERIDELLAYFAITSVQHQVPSQLSGGQAQRVAIARALVRVPRFLLADEPTGSLDAENAAKVIALCKRYQQEHGMGLIVATHDPHIYEEMDEKVELSS
jgi:lipoprotein-releasing system ATP-binding protein